MKKVIFWYKEKKKREMNQIVMGGDYHEGRWVDRETNSKYGNSKEKDKSGRLHFC